MMTTRERYLYGGVVLMLIVLFVVAIWQLRVAGVTGYLPGRPRC
ncbi:MAG: hypothetical protein K0R39_2440 [Symbiobacteriaceae bacterium]|jgi:hypothetical protein|nr:hypothetical protein [Symbiobacteriaceae bacterium]